MRPAITTVVSNPSGYTSSSGGANSTSTPSFSASALVALLVARVAWKSSPGANWAGFTNSETTTTSLSSRARRISERWPSWK